MQEVERDAIVRALRHAEGNKERASELLVSTDYSIDRIAEACGFANRYYFTRVFTQRMGLPPGRYRSERPHLPVEGAA